MAGEVRSLQWLRPTGVVYRNTENLARARARRQIVEAGRGGGGSSANRRRRVAGDEEYHGERHATGEGRSPPRQAITKHARESPKAARRAVTTDRRQRAAAAAFVTGTPCENCGLGMSRCFGSGRFCGQTCASRFSRVGRAVPASDSQSSAASGKKPAAAGEGLQVDVLRPCEACAGPIHVLFGSGRFCKKACAARFSRVGTKLRTQSDQVSPAPEALKPRAASPVTEVAEVELLKGPRHEDLVDEDLVEEQEEDPEEKQEEERSQPESPPRLATPVEAMDGGTVADPVQY